MLLLLSLARSAVSFTYLHTFASMMYIEALCWSTYSWVILVGMNGSSNINILRDNGASQSLLVKNILSLNEQSFTGTAVAMF